MTSCSRSFLQRPAILFILVVVVASGCQTSRFAKQPAETRAIDKAFAQDFERTKDLSTGTIPRERLLAAVERQNELFEMANRAVGGISWQERGPVNVGGRIRAVLVDKNDATNKKVWVGGVGGGIWHTDDITAASPVWVKANDFLDNMAVTCLIQDPLVPNTMYAGTGEGYFNADGQRGLGIFKSTDGGESWLQTSSTLNFEYVQELAFDASGKLYATVRSGTTAVQGVVRSADGGTSWTQVLTTPTASSNRGCDIKVSKDGDIYASMGLYQNGGIYRSPAGPTAGDAGTWVNITPPVAGGAPVAPSNQWTRIRLALSPSDNNVVYAILQGGTSGPSLFFEACRSIQQYNPTTNTWTVRTVPKIIDQNSNPANYPVFTRQGTGGQAWYDLSGAVDPNDPATLLVSGVDICKSTDNGATWNQSSVWTITGAEMAAGYTTDQLVHADHHNLLFVGGTSTTALFATDGGMYYSTNVNTPTNKPSFAAKNSGLNITQLYSTAIHPTTGTDYFLDGCQDNGSHKYTSSGLNSVTEVSGGDGGFCHISPLNPNHQITSYTNNNYYISTDGGLTFPSSAADNGRGSFINPSDYDGNNLYAGDDAGFFFRWTNPQANGATGSQQAVAAFGGGGVTHVSISNTTANRVYFGLGSGGVVRVDNAHTSNVGVATGTPRAGSVSCIANRSSNEDSMLVSYSNYGGSKIYVTANGTGASATFVDVTGNLPDMPVRWVMFDPRSHKMAIAATELGVWSCDDISVATPQWTITSSGLARVRVDMLKYRSSDRTLLAATHGRGLFSATIPADIDPAINFSVGTMSIPEKNSGVVNTCSKYTDYPAGITVNGPPNANANVTLAVTGGTASEGLDYDILIDGVVTKTFTIPANSTDSKPFSIRVYDDAIAEGAETINLNFSTAGGGSSVGTANATLTITVADDDVAIVGPTTSASVTLSGATATVNSAWGPFWGGGGSDTRYQTVYLASELTAAGLSAGSNITELSYNITSKVSVNPYTGFTIKLGHTAEVPTTTSGFLPSTGQTTCYSASYSTTLGTNAFTFATPFVWDGVSNVTVQTCFDNTVDMPGQDFVQSKTSPLTNVRTTTLVQSNAAANLAGCNLSTTVFFINANRAIIGLKHFKPGSTIETAVATAPVENLSVQPVAFDFFSASKKVLAKLSSPSLALGCVTASIENSGNGVSTSFAGGMRSSKVWKVTPTANGGTTSYTVTFYMTAAELAGVPNVNLLPIFKSSAANIGGATAGNTVTAPTTISTNAEFTSFTATFTGLSIFFVGTPAVALPVNANDFAGVRIDNGNQLSWKASEKMVDRYVVERSFNAADFISIGAKTHVSGQRTYRLDDAAEYNGTAYYRLKTVSLGRGESFSRVVAIAAKGAAKTIVFPTATSGDVEITTNDESLRNTFVTIVNSQGALVEKVLLVGNRQTVSLRAVAAGVYYFRFANDVVQKIVKQ